MTMHLPLVASLYAALLGLLGVLLAVRVSIYRVRLRVESGDGGEPRLAQAIRAHGNFIEHAPLALLLIVLAEGLGALPLLIHLLGLGLLLGRMASAWGLSRSLGPGAPRTVGAGLTLIVTAVAALLLLYRVAIVMSLQ